MTEEYKKRLESNKTVEDALRRKAVLAFTFEKNMHQIDISKKEFEDIEIAVNNDKCGKYVFGLDDISINRGDFNRLLKEYSKFEGITEIKCVNRFQFEKFVGKDLEKKQMINNVETEFYTTGEKLISIYFKAMN